MHMRMFAMALLSMLGGCSSGHPPLATEPHVDLQRFMGDWYVIAVIPTVIERGAHNSVESYHLDSDGSIDTTFTFRKGSFDGKPKRYEPRGFVRDKRSNAVWGMQFVWPIKADYRIVYVSPDYQQTIVGREKRDNLAGARDGVNPRGRQVTGYRGQVTACNRMRTKSLGAPPTRWLFPVPCNLSPVTCP